MTTHLKNRDVRFSVEDGHLVRTVTADAASGAGRTYVHRCTKAAFQSVAHAVAETAGRGGGDGAGRDRPAGTSALHPGERGTGVPQGAGPGRRAAPPLLPGRR